MLTRATLSSRVASATAVAFLLLTGCAAESSSTIEASSGVPSTRTVQSEFGEVELPTEPQRALGMYTTDLDILLTLGVPIAEEQPIRGDGWTTFPDFFPQEPLEDVEPFKNYPEYNYEKLLEVAPDLILNGLGYDKELVKRLPDIAPTYSIDAYKEGADWRDTFKTMAEALGKTAEYEEWMTEYEAKVEDVKARLDDAGVDPVVASVSYWEGKVSVDCYGVPCLVFEDLGLQTSPLGLADNGIGTELSSERYEELHGIDVAFMYSGQDAASQKQHEDTLATLSENDLWAEAPFIENDELYTYDMEMIYGSPSGHWALLEVVEQALLN